MQKWEYMYLSCAQNQNYNWVPRYVNGVEISDWSSGPQLQEMIRQLGQCGWELVNFVTTDSPTFRLIFKRPA